MPTYSRQIIPKEQLGTISAWQPDAFGIAGAPTAKQVEAIYAQARGEGFAAGREQALAEARIDAEALRALLAGALRELRRFDEEAGHELIALSLEIARQVLRQALAVRPELVLAAVQEAVDLMPPFSEHARLALHPDDVALVQSHIGPQLDSTGWRIVQDARIERGGCRVETVTAEIDSTLPARWRQVVARLGGDASWLV